MQGFVEQAGRAPAAGHAEQLLRRVELNLRVTPEQWQAVQGGILTPLLGAGAEIGCLITVLAHAEAGFPEAVVDGAVREWLRKEQIHAEVRKQLLGLPEPTAVTEPTLLAVSRET